ncbi:MAG: hypothetical protein IT548_08835 [Alphaproteobacteria bacterium]|nr:hypothetical protein [Alphaproteobacteria bacterium]
MSETGWQRVFLAAGLLNLVAGLLMVLAPATAAAMTGLPLPADSHLFVRLAGGLIATMGIGYLMAAGDLDRHRGIVAIGAIGKASAWLLMLIYWLNGTIGFWAFAAFAIDLIFAILFTRFLLRFAAR